ncbi:MAG: hypothetical protein EOO04_28135, partial [Chitinophagaceae bacterium]
MDQILTAMSHCLPIWIHRSGPQELRKSGRLFFLLLCILSSQFVFAQSTVTGKVLATDSALAGVTVQIKGSTTSTVTDNEGNFSINA